MTLNQLRRNSRLTQVCGRSPSTQGGSQPNCKRAGVCLWTCEHGHACTTEEEVMNTSIKPFLPCSGFCTHQCEEAALGRVYLHPGRALGWILLPGEERKETSWVGTVKPLRGGAAPGKGQDGGRRASLQLALPMPALLHLLARRMRSLRNSPAGVQLLLRLPQTRFPPWSPFICQKGPRVGRAKGEHRFLPGHRTRSCPPRSFPLLWFAACHQGHKRAH